MSPSLLPVIVDAMALQGRHNIAMRLVAADAQPLPAFEAGAHVDIHLPNRLVRQYSIASNPAERSHYVLCVRREAASRGGSAWVHDHLRVGQRLHIGTPRNLFSLTPAAHTILVAGGIGVTPLLAMAYALQEQAQSFELHYYVRDRSDAAFMHQLERRFAPGQVQLHCSAQGDSLRHGLPTALQTPRPDGQIYTCGPDPFMHHLRTQALALGWQADQLHQEAFGAATSAAGSTGQPGEDQAFEVQLASSQQIHVIPPGQSIASVLLNAGVDVPVSCEMGICGACLTTVEDGEPDHRDSVQTPEELAATPVKMAVCCSRARSPRLVLRL